MENNFAVMISAFNAYGFLIALGILAGIAGAYFIARYKGFNPEVVFDISLWAVPLAIIGARVYFLIFEPINTGKTFGFWEALGFENNKFDFSNGNFGLRGLAIYGAVIGAVIGIIINASLYKRKGKRETVFNMMDLGAPFLLLGQAIGRWGNFANKELYGREITNPFFQNPLFAVEINGRYYQALFLYESIWNLIGCGLLLWFFIGKRRSFAGFVTACYFIWYGFIRLILESFRPSEAVLYIIPGVLPVSQLVSIFGIILGLSVIIYMCYKCRMENKRIPIFLTRREWKKTGRDMFEWGRNPLKPIARKTKNEDFGKDFVDYEALEKESLEKEIDKDENSTETKKEADKKDNSTEIKKETDKKDNSTEIKKEADKKDNSTEIKKETDKKDNSTEINKEADKKDNSTEIKKEADKKDNSTEIKKEANKKE